MAYTPHTWQANELVTPEKLNAIEIGLGNTISNTGSNTIDGNLTTKGIYVNPTNSESNAFLLLRRPEGTYGANINFSRTTSNLQFTLYPTDYDASKNNYCTYYIESAPTGASSSSSRKILSTANIVNDLTSASTSDVLSANMGKTLNDSKLNLSGGTLTGTLTLGNNTLIFKNGDRRTGLILNSGGQFHIYSYPSDNTDANTTNREWYHLPLPDSGRTETGNYTILTSKTAVTVNQGGTGADTAAAARTNLGITPANIGALATSGGTMSGGLTTAQLDTTGDVYFHPNNGTTTYLKFSRNNLTSNIMVRLAATAGGQFTIREYPTNNTSENDSASELYYLPTPETNLTSQKNYLILTTRSLITVAQGGTGISATDAHKVFIGPTSGNSAAPSWRILEPNDIPSLNASKITTGTLAVSRGGTGVSTTSANYVFAGPSDKADAPSFRKLQAVDIPSLTKSKISDINFGDATLQYSSNNTAGNTISVPNGRGIIIISRAVSDEDDKIGIYHVAKGVPTIHYNGGLAEGKSPGITVSKAGSTSNFSITVNSLSNHQYRITWFLYT